MKILYLCHRIPYPPNKGDKIRSFNEIKYLSSFHEVHLVCLADNPTDLRYENDLKKYCKRVCVIQLKTVWARAKSLAALIYNRPISVGYFYSKLLQATVNRWLSSNHYDSVMCFSSPMAEYIFRSPFMSDRFAFRDKSFSQANQSSSEAVVRPLATSSVPLLVMDFCDVDSDKWLQYSGQTRFPLSFIYRIENRHLFEYEKKINQLFDYSIFVSHAEANLFVRLFPEAKNISVIPNGVDYEYFSPGRSYTVETDESLTELNELKKLNKHKKPILLFTGAMDYYANVDGVTWFCNDIFPLLKKKFPKAQFYIVGSNPHAKVKELGKRDGVESTGFVEDIRPYYQSANVCVIPLRLARGVQNKVLEAMAMGKPVVTTTKAIEGIQAVPEKHVLIEDTPQGFCDAVLRLLKDRETRERLGAKGRKFVEERYDWTTNMKKLDSIIKI